MEKDAFVTADGTILHAGVVDDWQKHTGVSLPQQPGPPVAEELDGFPTDGATLANADPLANMKAAEVLRRIATSSAFDQQDSPG